MDYEKILEKAIEFCTSAGIKLVLAVIILLVGFKLIKVLTKAIAGHNAPHMDKSLKSFFRAKGSWLRLLVLKHRRICKNC